MAKGRPVIVPITSRIIVYPAYFYKANPNYKRLSLSLEKNSFRDIDSNNNNLNPNNLIRSIRL